MNELSPLDGLFQSPEEWISLFGEVPCGYLLTDPKGRIHLINGTLLDWLKYTRKEVEKEMRFQDMLPIGERIFYESRHVTMLNLQKQVNELNYNLIGKEGTQRPMLVNSARRLNKAGEVIALQFVFFLFSDRKKYEQELLKAKKQSEEAAAAKSNFLSIVSHEVRTPIHAILNAIEILMQDDFSTKQKELLKVIQYSSNNLIDVVNSVLDITKMEAGKVVAIKEPFSIGLLLNQILTTYQPLAQKKNIDFKVAVPEDIPKTVIGDKSSLRQILINLIGNAIKFTQKGKVELNVKLLAMYEEVCTLQFVLKDTGIGISKEELNNIFEPFTQANQSVHQQYGGTGLGLSISKQILQLLDSGIKVESELGKGSTFMFELKMPVSKELATEEESFKVAAQPNQFAHLKVLLVDDVYSNILIIKRYFEMWYIPFEYVSSGKDAIVKMQNKDFDLVLMDISMPEMDGYQTTEMIRSLEGEKFQQIPIIALSAFDVSEIEFKVKRSGMNDMLPKPFKGAQLYETIIKWTSSNKLLNEPFSEKIEVPGNEQIADRLSLSKICDLFDEDHTEIKEFLTNVLSELKESVEEIENAKAQYSLDTYRSAIHGTTAKIGMFDLHLLKDKILAGEKLLKGGEKEMFTEKCNDIIFSLQELIDWLEKKINEGEMRCRDAN